jgi:ketosteroid isomerase-like protein
MKVRSLFALVELVVGFVVRIFAQQTSTPDPQLREQLLALSKKIDNAFDNNDAAAMAPLYTDDAVLVAPEGPVFGREAIAKFWIDLFQKVHISNHFCTVDQNSPHIIGTTGNEIWGNGGWGQIVQGQSGGPIEIKGYFSYVLLREGDAWKFRMETWNITPAAAPAQTNAAPTSAQEKSMVDPQVRLQIEALFTKFQEAYNNRDLATIGALHSKDAIEVRSWQGLASGGQAIDKRFAADFATNPGKMVNKVVALYPIGSAICEIADSDVGGWKAQTVTIYVREGDTWKATMTYVNNEKVTR